MVVRSRPAASGRGIWKIGLAGALFVAAAVTTPALAGALPVGEPVAVPPRDDVRRVEFKGLDLEFRWTGHWVYAWAPSNDGNSSSFESKSRYSRYCYNDECQNVTIGKRGSVTTFSTADGGYFEFTPTKGGMELAGRFWRNGFLSRNFQPDATATFHADAQKPAPAAAPASGGSVKWAGTWSWHRGFGGPLPTDQRLSIELLDDDRVRLCFDLSDPKSCGVYPFQTGNASYTLSRGTDWFDIRNVDGNLFGQYWYFEQGRTSETPAGTFLLKLQK